MAKRRVPVRPAAVAVARRQGRRREDIAYGHRIRAYRMEALQPGGAWTLLCEGTAVGHKRIETFDAVDTQRLRLTVTQRVAEPVIRELAAYEVT